MYSWIGVINVITIKTPQAFNWAVTSEMSCPFQASAEARHGPDPVGQFQPAGFEPKKRLNITPIITREGDLGVMETCPDV